MSRYPYLLFDADNTLFDFTAAEQIAFRRTCEKNGIPCVNPGSVSLPKGGNPKSYAVYENGTLTVKELNGEPIEQYEF